MLIVKFQVSPDGPSKPPAQQLEIILILVEYTQVKPQNLLHAIL